MKVVGLAGEARAVHPRRAHRGPISSSSKLMRRRSSTGALFLATEAPTSSVAHHHQVLHVFRLTPVAAKCENDSREASRCHLSAGPNWSSPPERRHDFNCLVGLPVMGRSTGGRFMRDRRNRTNRPTTSLMRVVSFSPRISPSMDAWAPRRLQMR